MRISGEFSLPLGMARLTGNFFVSRSIPKPLDLFGFAGFPLVTGALIYTLHGLDPALGYLPAGLLGLGLGLSSKALRAPVSPPAWLGPAILGLLPALNEFLVPAILQASLSLDSVAPTQFLALATGSILGRWGGRSLSPLSGRGQPFALLALALAIFPVVYALVPRLGPSLTGLVGACFLVAATLLEAPHAPADDSLVGTSRGKAPSGSLPLGLLLGGAIPLIALQLGPSFGSTIPTYTEALFGFTLGRLLGTLRRRSPFLPIGFSALVVLGISEALLRTPQLVAEGIGLGLPPLVGTTPLVASLLVIGLTALLGLTLNQQQKAHPHAVLAGVLLFLTLPGFVQLELALRTIPILAALIALFERNPQPAQRPSLSAIAALLCLSGLLLPQPSRSLSVGAAFKTYAQPNGLAHHLRTREWRRTERLDSARGGLFWSRSTGELEWWQAGQTHLEDRQSRSADQLFVTLPLLLGYEPGQTLLIHPGAGSVLHPARTYTPRVRTWATSGAHRYLLQSESHSGAASDPSVRIDVGGAAWTGALPDALLLVDLPAPWQPGAIQAWSPASIRRLRAGLAGDSVAVFRLPLDQIAGPSLAGLINTLTQEFAGLDAWLDPSGSDHLLILARLDDSKLDVGSVIRSWTRPGLQAELQRSALRAPADLLERHLLDRTGLLEVSQGTSAWTPASSALLAGTRVRRGARTLPLAELSRVKPDIDRIWSFESVATEDHALLRDRLEKNVAAREAYLSLLEAIALGDSTGALALAGQVAASSTEPSKDLKILVQPWIDKGDRYFAQQLFEQAHAEYLVALSFSGQDRELRLRMARTQAQLGQLESAEEGFLGLLEETPSSLEPGLGLAEVYQLTERAREAAELLEGLEKLHPGDVRLLINLGAVHLRLAFGADEVAGKHIARARVLFQTASSLEPRMARPRGGLAEVFSLLGEHERALTEIDRAIALEPTCTYQGWRGQILWQLGQNKRAETELSTALLECPSHLPALVALGAVLVDRGCYQQGREAWERALALKPKLSAARVNLEQLELSGLEESLGDSQCR